jgi:hypothetical protein
MELYDSLPRLDGVGEYFGANDLGQYAAASVSGGIPISPTNVTKPLHCEQLFGLNYHSHSSMAFKFSMEVCISVFVYVCGFLYVCFLFLLFF